MGSYSSTLVASGKLRLTLRGPRFRGRYLAFGRVAGLHCLRQDHHWTDGTMEPMPMT